MGQSHGTSTRRNYLMRKYLSAVRVLSQRMSSQRAERGGYGGWTDSQEHSLASGWVGSFHGVTDGGAI